MSYIVLFLLIACGYILGAPIAQESLHYHVVECIPGENETLSQHVIEITNINETCIRVNKSSSTGDEVYFYVVPETETGIKIHINTEDCLTPLPDLHLSLCDDQTVLDHTEMMVTFGYNNISFIEPFIDEDNSTIETILYTGPVVFETLHNLNNEDEEQEDNVTNVPSNDPKIVNTEDDSTSEEN